jgi:hypothetical protein
MMKKLAVVAMAGAALLASGVAYAAEATGAIRTWNEQNRQVTLDNGQTYILNQNVPLTGVQMAPGQRVTITYDVTGGQNMVTRIAVAPAAGGAGGAGGAATPAPGGAGGATPAPGGAGGGAGGAGGPHGAPFSFRAPRLP